MPSSTGPVQGRSQATGKFRNLQLRDSITASIVKTSFIRDVDAKDISDACDEFVKQEAGETWCARSALPQTDAPRGMVFWNVSCCIKDLLHP